MIEEHLTDITPSGSYHLGQQGGRLIKNWYFPDGWKAPQDGQYTPILKVQEFAAGGYEATIRMLDLGKVANAIEGRRRYGKREKKEDSPEENRQKSAARAKRKVRHLVKNMGATHLVTLTRREKAETGYWSPEDWAKAWDRARRNLERLLGDFPYVAVLEQHKKGNYHLHVAWVGKVNLNVLRPIWWSCCGGRGQGNVDAQHIKVRQGLVRADRVASYISKYTSKHFEDDQRFNKKRYWASRQTMAEVRRYVLSVSTIDDAMNEVRRMLGLDYGRFMTLTARGPKLENMFMFPDGSGIWINYIPELHGGAPPPF